jgi:hypothetical protein
MRRDELASLGVGDAPEHLLLVLMTLGVVERNGVHRGLELGDVIPGCLEADPSAARKHFFLKKEAKTFARLAYALGQRERLIIKSFLVLFLKKELLPFCFEPHLWSRSGMSQT